MSLVRHILILFFIFATYQSAKSEDDRSTPKVDVEEVPIPTETDAAKFNFSRDRGSLTLKISMEKAECVNDKTSTETSPSIKTLKDPEEAKQPLGAKENPAESCNDVDDNGTYYIKSNMTDIAIKVTCNVQKKSTCLFINSKIEASSINSTAITIGDQIWLSQTNFDVQLLYNKIEGITGTNRKPLISHLLSTSTSVNQTIKYYYSTAFSNGTFIKIKDNKVKSLKALLWNDHLVGSEITKQFPMRFTFSPPEECWSGNSDWMCSFINFQNSTNTRLPVTDFYIEDVRAKPDALTKVYFDLVDLCFSYD